MPAAVAATSRSRSQSACVIPAVSGGEIRAGGVGGDGIGAGGFGGAADATCTGRSFGTAFSPVPLQRSPALAMEAQAWKPKRPRHRSHRSARRQQCGPSQIAGSAFRRLRRRCVPGRTHRKKCCGWLPRHAETWQRHARVVASPRRLINFCRRRRPQKMRDIEFTTARLAANIRADQCCVVARERACQHRARLRIAAQPQDRGTHGGIRNVIVSVKQTLRWHLRKRPSPRAAPSCFMVPSHV